MLHQLARDLVNSLTAHIAVLDADGNVVAVNEPWRAFARDNGGDGANGYVGVNYLAECERAVARGTNAKAAAIADGIHDLLDGRRHCFAEEYPCPGPDGMRWFEARGSCFDRRGSRHVVIAHEDITARKDAEDRLQETETTLRRVLEALPVGVWVMDAAGTIVHGNPAGHRIWSGARYVGPEEFGQYKGWWLQTGEQIAAEDWAGARAIRKGETSVNEEIVIEAFDGTRKIILNSAIPLRDAANQVTGAIIVNQDITTRMAIEGQLRDANAAVDATNKELQEVLAREQHIARTDELTGLDNRRHFFELAQQLFNVAERYRTPFSLVLFDLDHFKQINDRYGHQAGDAVLRGVADRARDVVREADVLARYGGEEFIVALPNTDHHGALAVAEHLRKKIAAARYPFGRHRLAITISAGVAEMLPGDDSLDRLISRADEALYAAKAAGRDCCRTAPGASTRGAMP